MHAEASEYPRNLPETIGNPEFFFDQTGYLAQIESRDWYGIEEYPLVVYQNACAQKHEAACASFLWLVFVYESCVAVYITVEWNISEV